MRRNQAHDYERVRPNGMVLKTMGNPMPGGGYVTTFTDITVEKNAQAALAAANVGLERRVQERTAALSAEAEKSAALASLLADANISKTRFLAAASHDLLQPLHAARLFAGAMKGAAEKSGVPDLLSLSRNVDLSITSAEQLIRTLLDISKLDAGGITAKSEPVHLRSLFDSMLAECAPLAQERGLSCQLFCPADLWVQSDSILLRSILQNFISNALRYTRHGGLLLGARRRGREILIELWDSGIGIAPEQQQIIFDEFQRLPATFAADKGVGLGLAIARRLAQLIGTRIELASRVGYGSCFSILLPRIAAPQFEISVQADFVSAPMHIISKTVLCVDDDPVILAAMDSMLNQWPCTTLRASSADDAECLLLEENIDVLLIDYHLGAGRTGLEVIETLNDIGRRMDVALITADSDARIDERAKLAGAYVMRKPLDPDLLKRWLFQSLSRHA